MTALERTQLLIIDDRGPEPLTAEQRRDALEIINDRNEKGSLLITSEVPVGRWHEIIGDPTLGHAILHRVTHRAHWIELKGDSHRKRHALSPEVLTIDEEKSELFTPQWQTPDARHAVHQAHPDHDHQNR